MSCEQFSDTLADFLERDVPESVRARMESHALMCDECGPLLADLRKLRIDAANLEELAPSHDLWSGISARIETPVVSIGKPSGARQSVRSRRRASMWIGLAAAGLIAVTATATYQITRQSFVAQSTVVTAPTQPTMTAVLTSPPIDSTSRNPTAKTNAAPTGSSAQQQVATKNAAPAAAKAPATVALANNKLSAAQTYDMEISRLRRVVDGRRGDLDSTTLAVLEKNLHIIDDAIAQCRKALRTDPSSSYLNESLTGALDNKVQLLRAAATLRTGL